jgi:hypothetical protein
MTYADGNGMVRIEILFDVVCFKRRDGFASVFSYSHKLRIERNRYKDGVLTEDWKSDRFRYTSSSRARWRLPRRLKRWHVLAYQGYRIAAARSPRECCTSPIVKR